MLDNEINIISPTTLSSLLQEWIAVDISGDFLSLSKLRHEIISSGLFLRKVDTEIEFIHPSFRAYLAALTIEKNDLEMLVGKENWQTSLLFWSSIHNKVTTNSLIERLTTDSIFLGRVMVERSEKRSEAGDAINEQLYFEQLFQCFSTFVKRFPVLLKDPPLEIPCRKQITPLFGKSAEGGFLMYWKEAESKTNTVHHVKCAEIIKMAGQTDDTVHLPLFLIPSDVIRKYHPLELVYIWVIRSVYDILAFTGIRGGIPINDTYKQSKINPAIPIITNRFLLITKSRRIYHPKLSINYHFMQTKPSN